MNFDIRYLIHAGHRIIIKIRILNFAAFDDDLFTQPRRQAPDDAGLQLLP